MKAKSIRVITQKGSLSPSLPFVAEADIEQFKEELVMIELTKDDLAPSCLRGKGAHYHLLLGAIDRICALPTFKAVMVKVKKLDELLEMTKGECPQCSKGIINEPFTPYFYSKEKCPACHGTGKTEPHPERLGVINLIEDKGE